MKKTLKTQHLQKMQLEDGQKSQIHILPKMICRKDFHYHKPSGRQRLKLQ